MVDLDRSVPPVGEDLLLGWHWLTTQPWHLARERRPRRRRRGC
jgi:hypothetical protein